MSSKSRSATLFVPVLVLATGLVSAQAGWSASVNVVAFTTAAPFTATVAGDTSQLALGMFVQNPFAGTPSILAINGNVITLTSEILPTTTTLPKVVDFATVTFSVDNLFFLWFFSE